MQIDYALILGAGLGTRMGEIGKQLPKILWPIYFKSLLELQIRYCQDLGIEKIYINTHYLHDEIVGFLKSSSLQNVVTVLHESPLLDSGGAIHNLAARSDVNYRGNLLLVNGDQFLFFEEKFWKEAVNKISKCRAVLFGIQVDKVSAYNETIIENSRLIEIRKNIQKDHDYLTYSGLGLLNLNGLNPVTGVSRFFETVADFKTQKVEFIVPSACEYWDFGTAGIYAQNIFKLKNSNIHQSKMGQFVKKHFARDGDEKLFVDVSANAIDLGCEGVFVPGSIHFREINQKL